MYKRLHVLLIISKLEVTKLLFTINPFTLLAKFLNVCKQVIGNL